jgi:hypothetical protein
MNILRYHNGDLGLAFEAAGILQDKEKGEADIKQKESDGNGGIGEGPRSVKGKEPREGLETSRQETKVAEGNGGIGEGTIAAQGGRVEVHEGIDAILRKLLPKGRNA